MPKSRYTQLSLEATSYYHYVSRCVRRTFLCGIDKITSRNYEHRKQQQLCLLCCQMARILNVTISGRGLFRLKGGQSYQDEYAHGDDGRRTEIDHKTPVRHPRVFRCVINERR